MSTRHPGVVDRVDRRAPSDSWRWLVAVGGLCAAIQIASATFFVPSFETPNTSTYIAEHLVQEGSYVSPAYPPPIGFDVASSPRRPLRAFQLPGEPLYLAAGFLILPKVLWAYLHVGVTLVLVLSIAAVGFVIGGRAVGIGAGVLASIDPFVMAHGPVWDDTFLAAALEWLVFAVTLTALARSESGKGQRILVLAGVSICAGWAAITRTQSQLVLACLALMVVVPARLRAVRSTGLAIALGVVVALTAWGVRNFGALGTFYIGSTHDGGTLYESLDPHVRARILATGSVDGSFPGELDQNLPASFGELDIAAAYRHAAVTYILAHPGDVVSTALLKVAVSLTAVDPSKPLTSPRNIAAFTSNALFLVLGPYGLWVLLGRSQRPIDRLLRMFAVVTALTTVGMLALGPNGARYRMTMTGMLHLGVAAALVRGRLALTRPLSSRASLESVTSA